MKLQKHLKEILDGILAARKINVQAERDAWDQAMASVPDPRDFETLLLAAMPKLSRAMTPEDIGGWIVVSEVAEPYFAHVCGESPRLDEARVHAIAPLIERGHTEELIESTGCLAALAAWRARK